MPEKSDYILSEPGTVWWEGSKQPLGLRETQQCCMPCCSNGMLQSGHYSRRHSSWQT